MSHSSYFNIFLKVLISAQYELNGFVFSISLKLDILDQELSSGHLAAFGLVSFIRI